MFKRFDLNCGEEIRSKKSVIRSFETFLTLRFFFFLPTKTFVENYSPGNRILIGKKLKILRDIARPLFLGINNDCIVHKLVYKA